MLHFLASTQLSLLSQLLAAGTMAWAHALPCSEVSYLFAPVGSSLFVI